jgi:hypothetical protein
MKTHLLFATSHNKAMDSLELLLIHGSLLPDVQREEGSQSTFFFIQSLFIL